MDFIERLKKYMSDNKIKQIDLSNRTGMSRGSISNILSGKRTPNEKLLTLLSEMSGKTINWWLFGEDEYTGLSSLNMLIDTFIEDGSIKDDGTYDDDTKLVLKTMLDKEIRVKIRKKKEQQN